MSLRAGPNCLDFYNTYNDLTQTDDSQFTSEVSVHCRILLLYKVLSYRMIFTNIMV